jgi:superfamily II DNA helicase RecQ
MVATNAFGLGVNKPNVRLVIYYGMTMALRNYVQETGRAGCDQLPAKCLMLYALQDLGAIGLLLDGKLNATKARAHKEYMDMAHYVGSRDCRKAELSTYFGTASSGECNNCDNCVYLREGYQTMDVTLQAALFMDTLITTGDMAELRLCRLLTGQSNSKDSSKGDKDNAHYGAGKQWSIPYLRHLLREIVFQHKQEVVGAKFKKLASYGCQQLHAFDSDLLSKLMAGTAKIEITVSLQLSDLLFQLEEAQGKKAKKEQLRPRVKDRRSFPPDTIRLPNYVEMVWFNGVATYRAGFKATKSQHGWMVEIGGKSKKHAAGSGFATVEEAVTAQQIFGDQWIQKNLRCFSPNHEYIRNLKVTWAAEDVEDASGGGYVDHEDDDVMAPYMDEALDNNEWDLARTLAELGSTARPSMLEDMYLQELPTGRFFLS